jgi:hypothetical protein
MQPCLLELGPITLNPQSIPDAALFAGARPNHHACALLISDKEAPLDTSLCPIAVEFLYVNTLKRTSLCKYSVSSSPIVFRTPSYQYYIAPLKESVGALPLGPMYIVSCLLL